MARQHEDDVYTNRQIAIVPIWYHCLVGSFLGIIGIIGISLNGFIIWSFALRRSVSTKIFYPISI